MRTLRTKLENIRLDSKQMEKEKSLSENLKGFIVGAEGVEPPTLCL